MKLRSLCGLTVCSVIAWTAGCAVDAPGTSDETSSTSQAATAAPTSEPTETGDEHLDEGPAEVAFEWAGLPDDGRTVIESRSTNLALTVKNTSAEALSVRLVLMGDNGSTIDRRLALGTLALGPSSEQRASIDLGRLGFSLADLQFSGKVHVAAHVTGADGTPHEAAISEPIFFHATAQPGAPTTYTMYGEKALQSRFRSGDFRGTIRDLEGDPDRAGVLRVMDVGSGNSTADFAAENALLARDEGSAAKPAALKGGAMGLAAPQAEPQAAGKNKYKTCFFFRAQTIDSGLKIAYGDNTGGVEDYGAAWNDGADVPAYGALVRIRKGTFDATLMADRATGCLDWSSNQSGNFEVTVYAYSQNLAGASVQTHDSPNDFSTAPGTTYSNKVTYNPTVAPAAGDKIAVGGYGPVFTATAISAFGLRRLTNSSRPSQFFLAMDNAVDGWSSAHWGSSNSSITSGRHYIKMWNNGSKPQSRRKFVVAHELGHAFAAIDYGARPGASNGGEPNVDSNYGTFNPFQLCPRGESYSINSDEYNSVGFREGFAHFLAAVIFNNKHAEGSFHWLGSHHDLERYANGMGTQSGGYHGHYCCFDNTCTKTDTLEDWMLFFWDYYTNVSADCSAQPGVNDLLALYSKTRLNGGLTKDNYYAKMKVAAAANASLPTCLKEDRFASYAAHNGIN
jgi:hypothetical protein